MRFAVIGGVATAYYTGGTTQPDDLDIVISESSASRAFEALGQIASRYCKHAENVGFSEAAILDEIEFKLVADSGCVLHVLGAEVAVPREELIRNKRWVVVDRTPVPMCSRDNLVALKASGSREKDAADMALIHARS